MRTERRMNGNGHWQDTYVAEDGDLARELSYIVYETHRNNEEIRNVGTRTDHPRRGQCTIIVHVTNDGEAPIPQPAPHVIYSEETPSAWPDRWRRIPVTDQSPSEIARRVAREYVYERGNIYTNEAGGIEGPA